VAFIEREGKEVSTGAVVSGRGGAVLQLGNLFKGRTAILADSQNGDIIILSQRKKKRKNNMQRIRIISNKMYESPKM
jgi:hypothetical protein